MSSTISTRGVSSDGGGLTISAGHSINVERSEISSNAERNGGDIGLLAPNKITITESNVIANAGNNGGNIRIGNRRLDLNPVIPDFVIIDKSDFIASAVQGNGGNISISADTFIGSFDSLFDASSQFGIDGEFDVSAPDVDIAGSLAVLPESFTGRDIQLQDHCAVKVAGEFSSFIVVGRGGVPLEPGDLVPGYELGE